VTTPLDRLIASVLGAADSFDDEPDSGMLDAFIAQQAEASGVNLTDPAILRAVAFGAMAPRVVHVKLAPPLKNNELWKLRHIATATSWAQWLFAKRIEALS
jgi:hypothetical protein